MIQKSLFDDFYEHPEIIEFTMKQDVKKLIIGETYSFMNENNQKEFGELLEQNEETGWMKLKIIKI